MSAASWNGTLKSADSEPSTSVDLTPPNEHSDESPVKRRRGRAMKESLPSLENGCSERRREESAEEMLGKHITGQQRKDCLMLNSEVVHPVNGHSSADVLEVCSAGVTNHPRDVFTATSSTKRNTRASNKDRMLPAINGNDSPIKQSKKMADSMSSSAPSDEDDDPDFELTSKHPHSLTKSKRKQVTTKSPSAKDSNRNSAEHPSQGLSRQRRTSVNGSISDERSRKSTVCMPQRTRRDVVVVEERMAVLNENLTVECVQPEIVTIKDESTDDSTAIITVENLSGVGALDLKPYVQKYKLDNGELSLEECEDSEIELLEDQGKS